MNIVPENLFKLYTACNFDQRIILNLLHIPYIVKQGPEYILFMTQSPRMNIQQQKKVHPRLRIIFSAIRLCYSIRFSSVIYIYGVYQFLNEEPAVDQ
jgi:hypothetical protein